MFMKIYSKDTSLKNDMNSKKIIAIGIGKAGES